MNHLILTVSIMNNLSELDTLSERIKERRLQLRLSQNKLANLIGVTGAAVSSWERGSTKDLKLGNYFKLTKIFGVQPELFFKGREG